MIGSRKQQPGESWTFVYRATGEYETGTLPSNFGESNEFARWKKDHWISRKFNRLSLNRSLKADGPRGLLGRMSILSSAYKSQAKNRNQLAPTATPEQMVEMWLAQDGKCAACKEPLVLINAESSGKSACFDHNHETGEPRGFIHQGCNKVEGIVLPMADEAFENLITWLRAIRVKKAQ
jgi:hypothetical protein